MSFGGPIDSMQSSHKSNKGLLKGRKRLKEIQSEFKSKKVRSGKTITMESPKTERTTYSYEYAKEKRWLRMLKLILFISVLCLIIWGITQMDWAEVINTIQ